MVGVGEVDFRFDVVDPVRARAAIAAALFHVHGRVDGRQLGEVTLHSHQLDAVSRLRAPMSEFGGALLCDPVGTGKTFVALALIPEGSTALVVAPAVLRTMWLAAAQAARRSIRFTSFEALSRGMIDPDDHDFLIVDEAHHARNPATRRFGVLSRLVPGRRVLLLSATPIHNKRKDLTALLSLFLGNRAAELTDSELGRCVLRRDHTGRTSGVIPRIERLQWLSLTENDSLPRIILALPPPLPPSDGGDGGALVAHSLIRQWTSSDGALRCGLRRRLHKAIGLIAALEDGTYPSRSELGAWIGQEDTLQLAFSALVAPATANAATLLPVVRTHHDAIAKLLHEVRDDDARDNERAEIIRRLRKKHDGSRIVAFTQFADTVDTLFARLVADGGVAALTGSGARVAGGALSRSEAIERFAPLASNRPPPSRADEITLLITTDLLSEGVNLQDASVVMHLDLPWTPARMEQRLGRIARIGSVHDVVFAYAIRPPASSDEVLRIERILRDKVSEAGIVTAEFPALMDDAFSRTERSQPAIMESVRETILLWISDETPVDSARPLLSVVAAPTDGFIAAYRNGDEVRLIASVNGTITDDPDVVLECVRSCAGPAVSANENDCVAALSALSSYLEADSALTGVRGGYRRTTVRTAVLRRISLTVQRARRHERATITSLATQAHVAVRQNLGIEAERQLGALCQTEMDDRAWLRRVIDQLSVLQSRTLGAHEEHSLIALIIFRACGDAIALSHATER